MRTAIALVGALGIAACQSASSVESNSPADPGPGKVADAGASKTSDASTAIVLAPDAWFAPVLVDAGWAAASDAGAPGSPPETNCLPSVFSLRARPAEALWVQDRSAAMAEQLGSGSKWSASGAGVSTAVASGAVAWGMMLFPKVGADDECCQMPTSDTAPQVEVTPGVESAGAFAATFAQTAAGGMGRPMARAIVQAANYLAARTTSTAKYIVLVTAGEPTCSGDGLCSAASTTDTARTKDAITNAASRLGIPVAVATVGLTSSSNSLQPGPTQQLLADLAKLGGMPNTAPGQPAYWAAASADELATAVAALVGQMKSCAFALPTPFDWGADAQVTLADVRLSKDPTHQDGWDFADDWTSIVLFGKACAGSRSAPSTVVLHLQPSCSIPVY